MNKWINGCVMVVLLSLWAVSVRAGVTMDSLVYSSEEAKPELIGEIAGWATFTYAGKADFDHPDDSSKKASASATEASVAIPFPVYSTEDWNFFAGPQVDWYRYEFDQVQGLDDVDVYDVVAQLAATYDGIEDWEFVLSLAPGFYTDFRKIGSEDFKTFANGVAYWRLNETVQLVGGVAYDTAFGGDDLFPVGGVRWDPSPTLSFQLIFPEPVILWAPKKGLMLFVNTLPAGGKWNTYDETPDNNRYSFETQGWRSGCGLEVQLTDSIWFHIAGGMEYGRNYEIVNEDGDSMLNSDVEDTWYSRVGIVIR
ncbi:MAG: DUF6268 family outer membrane beta-barrel protein [Kiritimatiellae bacterium]|nr:DUF6268 family outer membrane beta-barrel protein [Kiritimatiellia bacterium]